jgi:DeoR/GlpR family transcriptional regulator of sugar metabolism
MDKLFIAVSGFDPERGAATIQPRRAKRVVIAADSSKVGMTSPAVIRPMTDID